MASLFLAYLVALAFIAFWPSPVDAGSSGATLRSVLAWLHSHGIPGWFNYNFVEFTANILLFVPFGFLGAAYLRRQKPCYVLILLAFIASCAIETYQCCFLEERFASVADILANTIGATIGCLFSSATRWLR
ncbi:VanZ family protein [Arthrobacter sp. Sa2CUA1]|uniref:VanZ family protein n=1 Tax=Arthrobacter gallicola TaxID=2762225 RepID=A0ABR8UU38_9MICC|nr:VanZ family protein [Arthrobacter gallicola]